MVLTNSCRKNEPEFRLVASKDLNFPSASALAFYNNRLYIFGDDAPGVLILDSLYRILDSISYFNWPFVRIPKEIKPDIESVVLTDTELQALGSMTTDRRNVIFHFPLPHTDSFYSDRFFQPGKQIPSLTEANIEGAFRINNYYVLANRANTINRQNHLIYWNGSDSMRVVPFLIPATKKPAGVSDLCYVKEKDLLLFLVTEEDTPNATIDGTIGQSYLGYVPEFSRKWTHANISADKLLPLISPGGEFEKQKVEGICLEKIQGNELVLHLAADNDNGTSRLFKILVKLY